MNKIRIFTYVLLFLTYIRFPRTKTLVQIISDRYGEETLRQFRKLEKLEKKLAKTACDIIFLSTCARYNLSPKFLQFRLYRRDLQFSDEYKSFQRDLLFKEIASKNKQLGKITTQKEETSNALRRSVSWIDYNHLSSVIGNVVHNYSEHCKHLHRKKLHSLGIKSQNDENGIKSVFNLSDHELFIFCFLVPYLLF